MFEKSMDERMIYYRGRAVVGSFGLFVILLLVKDGCSDRFLSDSLRWHNGYHGCSVISSCNFFRTGLYDFQRSHKRQLSSEGVEGFCTARAICCFLDVTVIICTSAVYCREPAYYGFTKVGTDDYSFVICDFLVCSISANKA